MELLQLKYFLAAAEYQHITKAAEHLQIAQPALSQAIHRLESELGVPLFERKNRSIELNDSGRFFQQRLLPLINDLDRTIEELQCGKELATHTIRLRLLSASALITNRIIAFRALRPDVNFQLYQSYQMTDPHANSDYDLCVTARRSDFASADRNHATVMLEEDLYLAVPSASPYGEQPSIRLADTRHAGYICLAGSRPIRQITNSYFLELGFSPRIIFERDTTETVRNLIAAGMGIGFWPQYSWGPLPAQWESQTADSPVRLLPISDLKCRRQIVLMRSEQGKSKPVVQEFCDFLVNNLEWM